MVLYGVNIEYLMWSSLIILTFWDAIRLKAPVIFTELPLAAALFYHFQHDTLRLAAVAVIFPFLFHLITFVRGRIAFYDLLALGMVGAVMGWPFGVFTVVLGKLSFWLLRILGIAWFFLRDQGKGYYVFPYVIAILAGAVSTYFLFKSFPFAESFLYSFHPEDLFKIVLIGR